MKREDVERILWAVAYSRAAREARERAKAVPYVPWPRKKLLGQLTKREIEKIEEAEGIPVYRRVVP